MLTKRTYNRYKRTYNWIKRTYNISSGCFGLVDQNEHRLVTLRRELLIINIRFEEQLRFQATSIKVMSEVREIESAVEHFASNQEFIRLYNRHNRELLLQHFLLIAAAGNEVWTSNHERKMTMPEQRDLMLVKYIEWLEKMGTEFPEVEKPFDVSEEWWRLMLLAYERKPISGKSLWRKFKEDTRNPILSSFNCHWAEPRDGETLEDRFKVVRRGVWSDLGHRLEEFIPEGSWLPKQWYAWRYCCYPGKNFRAFDGKLPTVSSAQPRHRHSLSSASAANVNNNSSGFTSGNNDVAMNWSASLPVDPAGLHDPTSTASNSNLDHTAPLLMHHRGNLTPSSNSSNATLPNRANRSTLPSTVANQRLLQAAASMSRVRNNPEDELNVQHYLADVQQYMAQMTRLEKAAALAEAFGEEDKAVGFKRQLYEHVQTEPPARLKRTNTGLLPQPLPLSTAATAQAGSAAGVSSVHHANNSNNNSNNQIQHAVHVLNNASHAMNTHNNNNNNTSSMNNHNNSHLHNAMVNLPSMLSQQQQHQQHHHQVQQQQQAQMQQQHHQQQQQQQRATLSPDPSSTTSSGNSSLAGSALQQL